MFFLNGALFGVWASRIPAVKQQHALDPSLLGLLLLCMGAGAIAAFPVAGRASDRLGSARVTRTIAIFYVFALIGVALSSSVSMLALMLFFFGATHGGMDVAMNAWAAEVERRAGRPMMASFHAMFSVGTGLGAATGYAAVTQALGILAHFCVTALVLAIVTLAIAAIEWHSDAAEDNDASPLFAWPRGVLLIVGFVALCSSVGEGAIADWSAVFLVTVASATQAQAALGYTAFSCTMVVMRFLGDRAVAALGPLLAARLSAIVAIAGALLVLLGSNLRVAIIGFALMGVGYAVVMPLCFSRAANDPIIKPGAALASVATLGYGGMLIGPPLIGFIADLTSLRAAFGLLPLLAVFIVLLSRSLTNEVGGDRSSERAR